MGESVRDLENGLEGTQKGLQVPLRSSVPAVTKTVCVSVVGCLHGPTSVSRCQRENLYPHIRPDTYMCVYVCTIFTTQLRCSEDVFGYRRVGQM